MPSDLAASPAVSGTRTTHVGSAWRRALGSVPRRRSRGRRRYACRDATGTRCRSRGDTCRGLALDVHTRTRCHGRGTWTPPAVGGHPRVPRHDRGGKSTPHRAASSSRGGAPADPRRRCTGCRWAASPAVRAAAPSMQMNARTSSGSSRGSGRPASSSTRSPSFSSGQPHSCRPETRTLNTGRFRPFFALSHNTGRRF